MNSKKNSFTRYGIGAVLLVFVITLVVAVLDIAINSSSGYKITADAFMQNIKLMQCSAAEKLLTPALQQQMPVSALRQHLIAITNRYGGIDPALKNMHVTADKNQAEVSYSVNGPASKSRLVMQFDLAGKYPSKINGFVWPDLTIPHSKTAKKATGS